MTVNWKTIAKICGTLLPPLILHTVFNNEVRRFTTETASVMTQVRHLVLAVAPLASNKPCR